MNTTHAKFIKENSFLYFFFIIGACTFIIDFATSILYFLTGMWFIAYQQFFLGLPIGGIIFVFLTKKSKKILNNRD